jgi:hypothetical protein
MISTTLSGTVRPFPGVIPNSSRGAGRCAWERSHGWVAVDRTFSILLRLQATDWMSGGAGTDVGIIAPASPGRLPPVARRPKGNQGNTQCDKIVRSAELAWMPSNALRF